MRTILYYLNFLLMIALPLLLGWFVARRRQISWRFFYIGAATFVLAQIFHIPFNYLVSNNLSSLFTQLPEMLNLLLSAVFLGLSAGVFEEGARYLSYRYWAKDARTWGRGLMMGVGHGGAESILLGLMAALGVTILLGYQAGHFQALVPPEQISHVQAVLDQMADAPWIQVFFGAIERSFTLCIQIALSLMVMQVFTQGRVIWFFLAVCWHALIDASIVLAVSLSGVYLAEAITALAALFSLLLIWWYRSPEPILPESEPLPPAGPAGAIRIEPSSEKLENSRYL